MYAIDSLFKSLALVFSVTTKIWNRQGGTGLKLLAEMTRLFKVNMTLSITCIPGP